MLGENDSDRQGEFFTLLRPEDLIPDDHILKKVSKVLDLGWLRDEVREFYSDGVGRPSIDPKCAVRLMLAGFFQGIVHDRKLMREAQVNIAIRWFAGYALTDRLPDHSTLSKLRKRWGAKTFRRIFERSVQACIDAGLVNAETVHVDATLIRANASWERVVEKHVDDVVRENDEENTDDAGKPDGKRGSGRMVKVSETDPDSSLTRSGGFDRPEPRYKQHTAVEDESGVVVDVEVTTGRTPEASKLIAQVERVEDLTGVKIEKVTADSSYAVGANFSQLEEKGIDAVIPTRREVVKGRSIPIRRFKYDEKHDFVKCPGGKKLRRSTKSVNGGWHYVAKVADCRKCRLKPQCVSGKNQRRSVVIVDGYSALLRARRKNLRGKNSKRDEYIRHKWLVEGRHGEAKVCHGLSRAVRRGLDKVAIQVYLTAAAMNLKRLATAFNAAFHAITSRIPPFWPHPLLRQVGFLFRPVFPT